jgi:hypothetical protein
MVPRTRSRDKTAVSSACHSRSSLAAVLGIPDNPVRTHTLTPGAHVLAVTSFATRMNLERGMESLDIEWRV